MRIRAVSFLRGGAASDSVANRHRCAAGVTESVAIDVGHCRSGVYGCASLEGIHCVGVASSAHILAAVVSPSGALQIAAAAAFFRKLDFARAIGGVGAVEDPADVARGAVAPLAGIVPVPASAAVDEKLPAVSPTADVRTAHGTAFGAQP